MNYLTLVLRKNLMLTIVLAMIGISIAFSINSSQALAARLSTDPFVIRLADITSQYGACAEIFKTNIGTSQEKTVRIACPKGTVTQNILVHRSQAIAQHQSFASYPFASSSLVDKQQALKQYQQLISVNQKAVQQAIHRMVHFSTACGNQGSTDLYWRPTSNNYYHSFISFYKTTDCSTVSFDTAKIVVLNAPAFDNQFNWLLDRYANGVYLENDCPPLLTGTTVQHGVGQSAPSGYTYENSVDYSGDCFWPWVYLGRWHNDMAIN